MSVCMAFESETMEQHISEGLKIIDLFVKRHYTRRLLRFMKDDGIDTVSKVEAILRFMYIMHDIGKGLRKFQRKARFGGHEIISAYIVDKMEISVDGQSLSTIARRIIALTILLHHHTLMKKNIREKLEKIRDEICPRCIDIIKRFTPVNVELDRIQTKINGSDVIKHVTRHLIRNTLGKEEYCRKAYILLIPLMVADNYAANKNRGGKGTVLSREINKIIFFWQKILGV